MSVAAEVDERKRASCSNAWRHRLPAWPTAAILELAERAFCRQRYNRPLSVARRRRQFQPSTTPLVAPLVINYSLNLASRMQQVLRRSDIIMLQWHEFHRPAAGNRSERCPPHDRAS
jgi:hypothetical protein